MKNAKLIRHFGDNPIAWAPMWGISKLRKRGGNFAGSINGAALWFDKWYDRVMSREGAGILADMGINLVILPFSLGGSHEAEKPERDDFSRMAEIFHEFGIKALPYLQYQNFLNEEHVPENGEWAVHADGSRMQYGAGGVLIWRRTVCHSTKAFMKYFKELFTDAIERGADGIWIDNNYLRPCYCENCLKLFREYLEKEKSFLLEELMSLKDFKKIDIPKYLENSRDPLVQAYLEFNCERNIKIHRELKSHLESLDANAIFGSNPGIYRGQPYSKRGIDFKRLIELNDLMYLENKLIPEIRDGQLSGNYHGFIACSELGASGIPGAWKSHDFDALCRGDHGMPRTALEATAIMNEAISCDGIQGMLWTVRTPPREDCAAPADLIRMYGEIPVLKKAVKTTLAAQRKIPAFGKTRNEADTAVVQHRENMMFDFDNYGPALRAAEEMLQRTGIPWATAFSENLPEACSRFKNLVLPRINLMSAGEADEFERFVENGGNLIVLGGAGLYDERYREREDFILGNILNISSFNLPEKMIFNTRGKGKTVYIPDSYSDKIPVNMMGAGPNFKRPGWAEDSGEITGAIEKMSGTGLRAKAENGISISIFALENGKKVARLYSYDNFHGTIEVSFSADWGSDAAEVYNSKGEKSLAEAENRNGRLFYSIENFENCVAMIF